MAQAGYTPISLYYSTTASAVPVNTNLVNGELAINITDGKLYYKDNTGTVKVIAGAGGTGIVAGSNTQIQFNNNGVFGASANLTWNGTTLSTTQINITGQGDLRLEDTTGGEYVALQAPGTLASSYTLTMPVDDGTNGQALITDGNGNLSWSTAASGDVYGPASATDNAIARFDLTTGKLIQNSSALVDDAGNVLAGAGLVGAPAFSTTGDTNTGIFFPAADTIAFTEGGVESMRIDSAGNLGLGTSSPTTKFQINTQDGFRFDVGAGATSYMRFGSALTGESTAELSHSRSTGSTAISTGNTGSTLTNRLTIDVNGFVGINNSTPLHILDVAGSVIRLNAASGQTNIILQQAGTTNGFLNAAGGPGTDLGVYANRFLTLRGTDAVIFYSNQTTERMRITSAGDVGIGTSSPSYLLDINKNQNGITAFRINNQNSGGSAYTAMYFGNDVNNAQAGFFTTSSTNNTFGGANTFNIWTQAGAAPIVFCPNNTEAMRITTGGLVLVGTTTNSTAARLQVGSGVLTVNPNTNVFGTLGGDVAGSASPTTYFGISYDTTNNIANFEALSGGVAWRNIGLATRGGNVGIGTSTPSQKLTITNGNILLTQASGNNYVVVNSGAASSLQIATDGTANYLYGGGAVPLTFSTNATERMRIDSSGNVGIGTTAPGTYGRLVVADGVFAGSYGPYGGPTNTGSSANYWKIGTWKNGATQSARLKLTLVGTTGYGTGQGSAGETTVYMVFQNSSQIEGTFYGYSAAATTVGNVAYKITGSDIEVWVRPVGAFATFGVYPYCTFGYWEPASSDTGSTATPSGASLLTSEQILNINGIEQVRINQYGIGLTSTPTSGTGITFPAVQAASSNANTLDDYEEGTWTPTITGDGGNPTVTYGSPRSGVYTKVGRVVYWNVSMEIASMSGGSGVMRISLPFTVASGGQFWGWTTAYTAGMNWGTNNTFVTVRMDQGGATFQLYGHRNNSGSSVADSITLPQNSLSQIYISGFYTAA